jgi:hypothetical protein
MLVDVFETLYFTMGKAFYFSMDAIQNKDLTLQMLQVDS